MDHLQKVSDLTESFSVTGYTAITGVCLSIIAFLASKCKQIITIFEFTNKILFFIFHFIYLFIYLMVLHETGILQRDIKATQSAITN